jgi:hypothetical protein
MVATARMVERGMVVLLVLTSPDALSDPFGGRSAAGPFHSRRFIWVDGTEFRWTRKPWRREDRAESKAIGGTSSSTDGGMMSLAGRWMR